MKKVVITGVSTGIGYSSAKILCDSGYFVYGSVRKNEDGERLTSELGDNFQSLVFDVTDSKTFRNIDFWLQMVLKKHGKKFPICVVANKIDRESERLIHMEDIKMFIDRLDANIIVLETSATHNINCPQSFRVMLSRISSLEILTTTVDNRTWFQKLFGV